MTGTRIRTAAADGTVAVVGAGPSGLGCAVALAATRRVVVVERIPVAGGTAGWDHPAIGEYVKRAQQMGVQFRLGETAIRWSDHHLLVTGPGSSYRVPADHLFFAGGLRPATTANLGLDGDRPAGIVAATVAEHLLQTQVPLWREVAVIGSGHWAEKIASQARQLGARVIGIGESAPWADEHHPHPQRWSVSGNPRVRALTLVYDAEPRIAAADGTGESTGLRTVAVACDAIVLAACPHANRNVDGAVLSPAPDVTFVQPVEPTECQARFDNARRAAQAWLEHSRKADAR